METNHYIVSHYDKEWKMEYHVSSVYLNDETRKRRVDHNVVGIFFILLAAIQNHSSIQEPTEEA